MNLLKTKYEVISELGSSTNTQTFLVLHKNLNTLRAAKFIKKHVPDYERYLYEANLVKNLNHSGIPTIYDIEEDDDSICIIEEYIAGKSLSTILNEKGVLSIKKICEYGIQICEILDYLHHSMDSNKTQAVLYLDLNPNHVLIDENEKAKLIDFDISSFKSQRLKSCRGSNRFAAPEQYHRLNLKETADIYSFGILLMYMATGGYMHSYLKKIHSKKLKDIIKKCIRHTPSQRYQNVNRIKSELEKILKYNRNENLKVPLVICVLGIKRGIGATYFALSLTNFFNRHNLKAVCIDKTEFNHYQSLISKELILASGAYKIKGTYLLPNYYNCVDVNLDDYEVQVNDYGVIDEVKYENLLSDKNHRFILISGGKYYEQDILLSALKKYENCVCVINYVSGRQFYQLIRFKNTEHSFFRMPFVFNWYETNRELDDFFYDIVQELFPEYILRTIKTKRGINHFFHK